MAGRGAEINEYPIGVEVLGRPVSYSPSDDATVRNRAYSGFQVSATGDDAVR